MTKNRIATIAGGIAASLGVVIGAYDVSAASSATSAGSSTGSTSSSSSNSSGSGTTVTSVTSPGGSAQATTAGS
jgi:hypothetical protein